MNLKEIHQSKVLLDIRKFIVSDMLKSIHIVNERLDPQIKPIRINNEIYIESIVSGYEQTRSFITVDVKLSNSLTPVIYISSKLTETTYKPIWLHEIDLEELITLKNKNKYKLTRNKILSKYIQNHTNSERIDLLEMVTVIFEKAYELYEIGGVLNRTSGLL